jgi:small subunit ribosomal protein S6
MNQYEALYILKSNTEAEVKEAEIEKFSACVTESGGEVLEVNKWGTKKFAYPIDYQKEGYYVLMTFKSGSDLPAELERRMKIADNVVRYKVMRKG